MRQIRLRRGRRAAPRLLVTLTVAVAMLGLGTNPAQADHEPVELAYSEPSGWPVTYDEDGDGANDDCNLGTPSSEDYTFVYPDPLPENPDGYPVVVWANGTDPLDLFGLGAFSNPTCYYQDALKHIASWGYVVIAPNEGQTGAGQELIDATGVAVWADNVDPTNPFYGKLDTDSIAAAGHSQGAIGAINAALDAPNGAIDSVLALSMPDKEWWAWANSNLIPLCEIAGCEALEIEEDATDQLDVPIFFARGTGLHNDGCEVDDWFSDQTHVDWQPSPGSSVPYMFATVKVDVPEENTEHLCDPPTDYWWLPALPHPIELYPHLDLTNATGYATAWLDYTLKDCFGYSPVAFTGATPEITQNSHWNPPPASHHSVIMNNLPTCP